MKAWWMDTAWPWLKTNWWMVLLAPLLIVPWLLWRLGAYRREAVVLDPLKDADERAKAEAAERGRLQAEEDARRAAELQAASDQAAASREALEAAQRGETDRLREDPKALVDAMKDSVR